jgi:hypothetical protein
LACIAYSNVSIASSTETWGSYGGDFQARRRLYLEYAAEHASGSVYAQAARLAAGRPPDEDALRAQLHSIAQRRDCSDFYVNGFLRLLYQFGASPLLNDELKGAVRKTLLDFKYWPDEPGIDSMCTWSENHQIMFSTAGYLAGQMFPEEVFTNSGQSGREKMDAHRPRILRWMDLRFRTGFSEWLSNVYYDEDLAPLLNLVDFCEDEAIAARAAMVVDLLLADMTFNSFGGVFGSTHGRTYEPDKKWAAQESTTGVAMLVLGEGSISGSDMSATCLALSPRYDVPAVFESIAADRDRPEMLNRERMGIRVSEASRWGLDFESFEDGMVFLSLEAYTHPRVINLFVDMLDAYNWWDNDFFEPFKARRGLITVGRRLGILPALVWLFQHDVTRNMREEVNIYTYRTPDYMLSSAQDYRRGYGGDQQHIWQATLGPDAACFTTHPHRRGRLTPNYWAGSGSLPRVAQVKNVVIAVYRISVVPGLYLTNESFFTHAWLPRDQFDEVVERDGWVFARRGQGYLALFSRRPYHWQTEPGEDKDRELIAPGLENTWICELGRRAVDGEFASFVECISAAPVSFEAQRVVYDSPSQGRLEFGWDGPLLQNGAVVPLGDYLRYDNPYGRTDFPAETVAFQHGEHSLTLDWQKMKRGMR